LKYEPTVAVVGAGHAGIEAALACARLGIKTYLFTLSLDAVANMPCNPSIGGTGKGHLVFEIDALGGEMGHAADAVTMQSRTLNEGKGPAVHSKRVQADRMLYRSIMKTTLESQSNLELIQAEITDVITASGGEGGGLRVAGVRSKIGVEWQADAVIVCAGTYLDARIIVGSSAHSSGPDGSLPAIGLTDSLKKLGVEFMRFKTGTPPRVHADSIDFSRLEVQPGETRITPFSARTNPSDINNIQQIPCHIVYTNAKTHEIIRANLDKSPLYTGVIKGTGPRYCPSIEDKVVRFADKERHQLFVEPMGWDTKEMYIQGFSSSLPADVQLQMLHSLDGFENAKVMRWGYAIEYDLSDPTQLRPTLEFKNISGLYGAGQFNGSSGYEEAAAQGLIAGINAACKLLGREEVILPRESSYIGTLIDDLVTKGTNEPYRIMTSRSEYRLLLRQDNADSRLADYGHKCGLLSDERYESVRKKEIIIENEIKRLNKTHVGPTEKVNNLLSEAGTVPISSGATLADLLRRPQITYEALAEVDPARPEIEAATAARIQTEVKYEGYIKRQLEDAAKADRTARIKLSKNINYEEISGLRLEARQKLAKLLPENIGQASRISGVSPADISVLLIYLKLKEGR